MPAPFVRTATTTASRRVAATSVFRANDAIEAGATRPSASRNDSGSPAEEQPIPDAPSENGHGNVVDWGTSFSGLSTEAFPAETATILMRPLEADDIEIKPDGIVYLPEIKYRRILNAAFGPGAWGLAPRGDVKISGNLVTREYALIVNGR
jgi:hypothetical protein